MVAVLLHRLADDAFQFDGNLRIQIARRCRLGVQHGIEGDQRIGAGERFLPRAHLVEDDAEGEQVAASVHRLAAGLLWRHVDGGARDDADRSQ